LNLRMSILGVFDICFPVFIGTGHKHQHDVNWDLLDNIDVCTVLNLFSASI
jgi:hypothetical protein